MDLFEIGDEVEILPKAKYGMSNHAGQKVIIERIEIPHPFEGPDSVRVGHNHHIWVRIKGQKGAWDPTDRLFCLRKEDARIIAPKTNAAASKLLLKRD